ncbi:MAG: hypothetical protein N3A62_09590, partial [Thermodesulfovibrionales bacterium]|nr:hypothetical protein [Thermodesulfovibrionales bacterium]
MRKVVFLLIIVSFIISAMMLSCAQKSQLPVMQDAITKTETKPTETKPTEPSTPKPTDIQRDKTPKETITERELQPAKREEVKTTIKELQGRFKGVYFDFDKYDIKDEAKPIIKQVADAMIANKRISLVIEGHCD